MYIRRVLFLMVGVIALIAGPASAVPTPELSTLAACDEPAPEAAIWPDSSSPSSWGVFMRRDFQNQACAMQRWEDQFRNEELQRLYAEMTPGSYSGQIASQASEPSRPRASAAHLVPGMRLADPFRTPDRWSTLTGGTVAPVSFIASQTGAKLYGDIFIPPSSLPGPYPGIIFATGGSQQFRQLYYWFAEGLAEEGYLVMMFDFQGQGDSETTSHTRSGAHCTTDTCINGMLPSDQAYDLKKYYDEMRDAIDFFMSTPASPYGDYSAPNYSGTTFYNPSHAQFDRLKLGVAGHSIGSIVSNDIGQQDQRVKAIVRYAHFGFIGPEYDDVAHAPTLIINDEYGSKGPQPWFTLPPPASWEHGFDQLVSKQIAAMQVQLRSSTHHEWTYSPGRYASRYGERVSFYYSLAWFDTYLKGMTDEAKKNSGFSRLTAPTFDASADIHSIGAGTWEQDTSGNWRNVPYKISGRATRDRLSYMLRSRYWLRGGALICNDMRSGGCPQA